MGKAERLQITYCIACFFEYLAADGLLKGFACLASAPRDNMLLIDIAYHKHGVIAKDDAAHGPQAVERRNGIREIGCNPDTNINARPVRIALCSGNVIGKEAGEVLAGRLHYLSLRA